MSLYIYLPGQFLSYYLVKLEANTALIDTFIQFPEFWPTVPDKQIMT